MQRTTGQVCSAPQAARTGAICGLGHNKAVLADIGRAQHALNSATERLSSRRGMGASSPSAASPARVVNERRRSNIGTNAWSGGWKGLLRRIKLALASVKRASVFLRLPVRAPMGFSRLRPQIMIGSRVRSTCCGRGKRVLPSSEVPPTKGPAHRPIARAVICRFNAVLVPRGNRRDNAITMK